MCVFDLGLPVPARMSICEKHDFVSLMAASPETEGGLRDEEGRDKDSLLRVSWPCWPCGGCIGVPGHRQQVSMANSVMTVDMTAVNVGQNVLMGHLWEHLKVAGQRVWLGHVTFTKSTPVSSALAIVNQLWVP